MQTVWARFEYEDFSPGPWFKTSEHEVQEQKEKLKGTKQKIRSLPSGSFPKYGEKYE